MQTLKLESSGQEVKALQYLLKNSAHPVTIDGQFGPTTEREVKAFQNKHNLSADGIVGPKTWARLYQNGYKFNTNIFDWQPPDRKSTFLPPKEYFQDILPKKSIFLHHTVSGPNPAGAVSWWAMKSIRVGTAFIIGGKALNNDKKFDGKICRAFMEYHWAHHLGMDKRNSGEALAKLNAEASKSSIAIEICSIGPVKKADDGSFFASFNGKTNFSVPADQVVELEKPFRGSRYYHAYSKAQIESCRVLILSMAWFFNIPLPDQKYDENWFEFNEKAAHETGIWVHTNARKDKSDCFPQPELIEMLNNLHNDFKTFDPENIPRDRDDLEMIYEGDPKDYYFGDMEDFDDLIEEGE